MGCLNKVFRVEIDVELFREAERTLLLRTSALIGKRLSVRRSNAGERLTQPCDGRVAGFVNMQQQAFIHEAFASCQVAPLVTLKGTMISIQNYFPVTKVL